MDTLMYDSEQVAALIGFVRARFQDAEQRSNAAGEMDGRVLRALRSAHARTELASLILTAQLEHYRVRQMALIVLQLEAAIDAPHHDYRPQWAPPPGDYRLMCGHVLFDDEDSSSETPTPQQGEAT